MGSVYFNDKYFCIDCKLKNMHFSRMKALPRSLFVPRDPLTRRAYLGWGFGLFAIKYLLDFLVTTVGLGFSWWPTDYFLPRTGRVRPGVDLPISAAVMMVSVAIPFIWIGINLTIRRLRTLGWSSLWACLFFVPYANFILFALLSIKTVSVKNAGQRATNQGHPLFSNGMLVALIVTGVCMALATIATVKLEAYGWGLFVGVPFFTGFVPAVVYRSNEPLTFRAGIGLMAMTQGLIALCFLFWKLEGIICILMAAPLSLLVGTIGVSFGLFVRGLSDVGSRRAEIASASFLVLPILILGEARLAFEPSLFKVTSRIEVNAPPESVWKSVVTFSELAPPHEVIFRAGMAYPIRAEIRGVGVGAVRHCVFSTGAFVEPITVWNEPSLLRFTVVSNPPPMRELSFAIIDPPHLHGFLESEQGQFELFPLPGGKTELVGTTWYRHGLWPENYWRLWSDYIIHTIHMRVLRHIKLEVEMQTTPSMNTTSR